MRCVEVMRPGVGGKRTWAGENIVAEEHAEKGSGAAVVAERESSRLRIGRGDMVGVWEGL